MQRNYLIIGGAVIVLLLLGVGGYFMFGAKKQEAVTQTSPEEEQLNVKKLMPADIGLVLSLRADKHAVNMLITKLDGIKSFDYEVTFDAEAVDPESKEKLVVPRGSGGDNIEVLPSDSQIKREIILGTSSSGSNIYYKVVSDIKFVIRINFINGEVGSVEDSIGL